MPPVLPMELVLETIKHIPPDGLPELASLCLVNSAMRACVRPMLYRTISLATRQQFTSFARSCASTDGGNYTSTLSLGLADTLPPGELDGLLQCLPNLANIRVAALDMRNVKQSHSASHLYLSGTLYGSHWHLHSAPWPHVTHLFIDDPYVVSFLTWKRVEHAFPSLIHLGIVRRADVNQPSSFTKFVQHWLNISTVRRLSVFLVYYDAQESLRLFPEARSALQSTHIRNDARVDVYAADATAHIRGPEPPPEAVMRRAFLAGAALGRDAFSGKLDVWTLGSCGDLPVFRA